MRSIFRSVPHSPFLATSSTFVLWQDRSPLFAYSVAILLAALYIWHIYPLHFLLGSGAYFEVGDAATNVTGWLFYVQDAWHSPLLHTERLAHPGGVNIAFTDSIPLAALLFKAIAPLLPAKFHYIGLWHALAYLTQALAATFLIRSLGLRHILATVAAVAFAVTWPALVFRIGHTALMTHALLLLALAFYFRGRSEQWSKRVTVIAFFALVAAALLIHPYFVAFCYPLFLAYLADRAIAGEGWRKQVLPVLASILGIALIGVLFGYGGKSAPAWGFGFYSMNMLAPFCGEKGQFFSCFVDGTGGQGEGYNYLGAGLLFLLPFAVAMAWPALKSVRMRYPALLTILILFTMFALSNRVYWGTNNIVSYMLPSFLEPIVGTFRSSGRFFWVVGYAILFACLIAILSRTSWLSVLLLAIALPLQWQDLEPLRARSKQIASEPGKQDMAPWKRVMTDVDKIHIYPAFGCGSHDSKLYLYFQRVASQYGKLIDTGYIPRLAVDCEKNQRFFDASFQPGRLYVASKEFLAKSGRVPAGFKEASRHGACIKSADMIFCHPGKQQDYLETTGLPLEPATEIN